MRVKLRPGTQFVPAARGVRCTRAGDSFLLGGPPALFGLIDGCLGELFDGTTVKELLDGVPEAARPVLDQVVTALLARDALFTVDPAVAPDPATAARYADVLSYVEEHCAEPHLAFAALRGARVAVLGHGPAAAGARNGLAAAAIGSAGFGSPGFGSPGIGSPGIGSADIGSPGISDAGISNAAGADPDLVIAVDTEPPPGVPVLPVQVSAGRVMVGPVLPGPAGLPRVLAAMERAGQWQDLLPGGKPPQPVAAVLAGSLAARRVLDHLLGRAAETLTVLHGPALDTVEVPLAGPPGPAEPWRGWAVELPAPAPVPPLHRAAFRPVDGTPVVHGWGTTAAAATADALLAVARARQGRDLAPGRVASAGTSEPRRRLDGALRLIGAELLEHDPGTPAPLDRLTPAARAAEATLRDYHERPVALRLRGLAGLDWVLATAHDPDGRTLAAEWAAGPAAALHAALAAVIAGPDAAVAGPDAAVGTWTMAQCGDEAVSAALAQIDGALAGRRLAGGPPVTGDAPPACAPMWLEKS